MKKFILFLSILFAAVILSPVSAAKRYLVQTGTPGNPTWRAPGSGEVLVDLTSSSQSFNTWYNATVVATDEVWIINGTYILSAAITMNKVNHSVYGGFVGMETSISDRSKSGSKGYEFLYPTIFDANNTSTVISQTTASTTNVLFDGLTIKNGKAANGGGALIRDGFTLQNCIISNNTGTTGAGGVYLYTGGILKNCLIENNKAPQGGGVLAASSVDGYQSLIVDCVIQYNQAYTDGGGIRISHVAPGLPQEIKNTTIRGNIAMDASNNLKWGGGVQVYLGNPVFSNCIIANNTGIANVNIYSGEFINTTIVNSSGYAVYCNTSTRPFKFTNCIIWGNLKVPAPSYPIDGSITLTNIEITNCAVNPALRAGTSYTLTGNVLLEADNNSEIGNKGPRFLQPTTFIGAPTSPEQKAELEASNWDHKSTWGAGSIYIAESTSVSDLMLNTSSSVNVASTGTLIIDQNTDLNSITVNPGGKLTINQNKSLTGTVSLQSSIDGTATLVDSYSNPTLNATVEQYVSSGRNWYISSPISSANYTVLNKGVRVVKFNEGTKNWDNVTSGNLVAGNGYIQVANDIEGVGNTGNVSFNGTTNSGDITIQLKRSGITQAGFNLVGNPYPSYLDWSKVLAANTDILPTVWYRTKKTALAGGAYTFATVNLATPESPIIIENDANTTISKYVPPMQAYWVRANSNNIDYTVTNDMRDHNLVSENIFKAPKHTDLQLLRLQVSNGVNSDEAIVYFNKNASDNYDRFDSPKMSNNSASLPEIYSLAGTEQLVINGLNDVILNHEIALGFKTGESNTFTIKASEIKNFESNTQVFIKDVLTNTSYELTDGSSYTFSSDATNTTDRFVIQFRSPSITTHSINTNVKDNLNVSIYKNSNNHITVNCKDFSNDTQISVYNALGQKMLTERITKSVIVINSVLKSGTYIIKLSNDGNSITRKIILD